MAGSEEKVITTREAGDRPSWTARMRQTEEGVSELLRERFDIAGVSNSEDLTANGLDSMARLELLALLERRFSVELTEDMISDFTTISRTARAVRSALEGKGGGRSRS